MVPRPSFLPAFEVRCGVRCVGRGVRSAGRGGAGRGARGAGRGVASVLLGCGLCHLPHALVPLAVGVGTHPAALELVRNPVTLIPEGGGFVTA